MPNYLARVVLHRLNSRGNDSYEDYNDFHAQMKAIGFEPFVNGVNQNTDSTVRDALPGGLYYFDNDLFMNREKSYTLDEATDAIYDAITEVVKDESKYIRDSNNPHSVFVTEVGKSMWIGLKPAPMRRLIPRPKPQNPFL